MFVYQLLRELIRGPATTVCATDALRSATVFETVLLTRTRTYIEDRRVRSMQGLEGGE